MNTTYQPRIVIEDLPALDTLSEEAMARIFGAGRQNQFRPGLETLETRELMAAGIVAGLTQDKVLKVIGTPTADKIKIENVLDQIRVIDATTGKSIGPLFSGVKRVQVDAGKGNDEIHYNAKLPATLSGGEGSDKIYKNNTLQVRPTLLIVIHGFWPNRDNKDNWKDWNNYGEQLRTKLEKAGSPTTTWMIDWESLKSPDKPMAELKQKIHQFLNSQQQPWDVFFFSHSRGAVLTANLVNNLGANKNLGKVQGVLLDPTASNLQGDVYPRNVPAGTFSHYDDGYVIAPFVTDTQRIGQANYQYVRDQMRPYFQAHRSDAVWVDRLDGAASAFDLINGTPYSWATAGIRAEMDALQHHVMIEDWYLNSYHVNRDLGGFLGGKPNLEESNNLTNLTSKVRLSEGSAKATVSGLLQTWYNTYYHWCTNLALNVVQNMVNGLAAYMVAYGKANQNVGIAGGIGNLGLKLQEYSPHWFRIAQSLPNDMSRHMSTFILHQLGPIVDKMLKFEKKEIANPGNYFADATNQFKNPYLVGRNLASALKNVSGDKLFAVLPSISGTIFKGFIGGLSNGQINQMVRKNPVAAINALVGAGRLLNSSLAVGTFLIKTVQLGFGATADTVYKWVGGSHSNKLIYAFWAIAGTNGANKGLVAGVQGLVGANLIENNSLKVGKFLVGTLRLGIGATADTVYKWVGGNHGDKLRYAFWAIAGTNGANLGLVAGIQGMIGAKLVENSSLKVGKFLLGTVQLGFGETASTVYKWVGGNHNDKLIYAFWAIAGSNGANMGLVAGVQGMVGANLVENSSLKVGKFLVGTLRLGLGTTADTVYKWVGGNHGDKLIYAFWALASSNGANKGLVAGIQGLVWSKSKLLANSSYAVGKFLLNNVDCSLRQTARTISDWLGGDKVAAFWAIVHPNAADRSYADGIRALIGADLLGSSYKAVSGFLFSQLSGSDARRVLRQLGFTVI